MTKDKLIIEEAKKHYSEDIKCYDAFLHGVEFAEKLSPWISTKDDLPCNHEELIAPVVYEDKIETLLVLANLGGYMYITKMKKSNGEWIWDDEVSYFDFLSPTYWMPIPKPPKD